jgi:RNA polymerase sigma factor (TIGR02999 family)
VTKSGQPSLEGDQPGDVTGLLLACRDGGRAALERILPILYEELRRIARAQLRREAEGHTLVTTALVHEAYLRLVDVERVEWRDRVHFLSMAARAMRRVLIDHARRHQAVRRGGGVRVLTLEETVVAAEAQAESLLALDEALDALAAEPAGTRSSSSRSDPRSAGPCGITRTPPTPRAASRAPSPSPDERSAR